MDKLHPDLQVTPLQSAILKENLLGLQESNLHSLAVLPLEALLFANAPARRTNLIESRLWARRLEEVLALESSARRGYQEPGGADEAKLLLLLQQRLFPQPPNRSRSLQTSNNQRGGRDSHRSLLVHNRTEVDASSVGMIHNPQMSFLVPTVEMLLSLECSTPLKNALIENMQTSSSGLLIEKKEKPSSVKSTTTNFMTASKDAQKKKKKKIDKKGTEKSEEEKQNTEKIESGLASSDTTGALLNQHEELIIQQQSIPKMNFRQCNSPFASLAFPSKLFFMLEAAEKEGFDDIISFLPNGMSFKIHKPEELEEVLPRYFRSSRWSSFQKQLSLYGFTRTSSGPDRGVIHHEFFRRDDKRLVAKIHRKKQGVPHGEGGPRLPRRGASSCSRLW